MLTVRITHHKPFPKTCVIPTADRNISQVESPNQLKSYHLKFKVCNLVELLTCKSDVSFPPGDRCSLDVCQIVCNASNNKCTDTSKYYMSPFPHSFFEELLFFCIQTLPLLSQKSVVSIQNTILCTITIKGKNRLNIAYDYSSEMSDSVVVL